MSYTITRRIDGASFEEVEARTREALSVKGFGVLTEIDVKATMKKKIDRDMDAYLISAPATRKWRGRRSGSNPRSGPCCPAT